MSAPEALPSSVVLDTHAWVWACVGDPRLSFLGDYEGRYVISAISVWELAMLVSKERLALKPSVDEWVERNLGPPVFLQPLTPAIALRSCALDDFHGDPADRIIVATALTLRQPLVTADEKIVEWFNSRPEWKEMFRAV